MQRRLSNLRPWRNGCRIHTPGKQRRHNRYSQVRLRKSLLSRQPNLLQFKSITINIPQHPTGRLSRRRLRTLRLRKSPRFHLRHRPRCQPLRRNRLRTAAAVPWACLCNCKDRAPTPLGVFVRRIRLIPRACHCPFHRLATVRQPMAGRSSPDSWQAGSSPLVGQASCASCLQATCIPSCLQATCIPASIHAPAT